MTPTPRSGKVTIDEQKLADLVTAKSDLSIRGQKKVWEGIADELQAPVESVKKAWSKLQMEEADKKIKESNRRRSLRTGTIDNSKDLQKSSEINRRSLRSSSNDKFNVIVPLNENSCASSTCSSPKTEDKRSLRSRSQLSSITETESISLGAGDASSIDFQESKDQDPVHDQTLIFETYNQDSIFSDVISDVIDRYSLDSGTERSLRTRFSEPSINSKKIIQPTLNASPKRGLINNKNNKSKRNPDPNDSTRAFFDSMALTVSTFPQHLQASMKLQICQLVGQIEYDLSLPKLH